MDYRVENDTERAQRLAAEVRRLEEQRNAITTWGIFAAGMAVVTTGVAAYFIGHHFGAAAAAADQPVENLVSVGRDAAGRLVLDGAAVNVAMSAFNQLNNSAGTQLANGVAQGLAASMI